MNIIETQDGDRVDMDKIEGNKNSVVGVFKSANGYFVYSTLDNMADVGPPMEYEGPNEGEDMEYIGIGFLV